MNLSLKIKLGLILLSCLIIIPISSFGSNYNSKNNKIQPTVWSSEKANRWYSAQPWISGCNFQPSTAINQIEMWQTESFDAPTIDKELGWAQELGFTTMRVFLSSVVWKHEPQLFKKHIDQFLTVSSKHKIRPIFVFFDDCWNKESAIGKQALPKPGVHNSGWVQDPSVSLRKDSSQLFPFLETYVKDILTSFKNDKRILAWDLYNEPGNSGHGSNSLPLLRNVFRWARAVQPSQPVTAGIYYQKADSLSTFMLKNSDIITYHSYSNPTEHQKVIDNLKTIGRPLICTEYMARRNNCTFQNTLPMLKMNNVGAINWGFVSGKTNTIFAWDEPKPNEKEPKLWFHDIYRQDKTPFDQEEINVIKSTTHKH